jgi:hypothetical protein
MKVRKSLWFVLPILCCLSVFVFYEIKTPIGYPYTQAQEVAMFDALNQKTLEENPPPRNAVELARTSTGIVNNELGRVLEVYYKISMYNESSIAAIVMYYSSLLESNGWKPIGPQPINYGSYFFNRGSACIKLETHPPPTAVEANDQYVLEIWFDYYDQSFSPPKPNIELLELMNFGQLAIDYCPP